MDSEYEIRFLDIDKELFIKKLEEINAIFVGDWLQKRYVYDFNPVLDNKWIRLRTNGIESTLTIKEVKDYQIDGTKELEIVVNDFNKTNQILEELGYHARSIQENKRIRYILDDVEIDIDTWPGLNTFVEFEGKNEESIKQVVEKLGLVYESGTTLDVQSIYLSKGYTLADMNDLNFKKKPKRKDNNMIKYITKEELDNILIEYFKKLLEDEEITVTRESISFAKTVITHIHSKKRNSLGSNCITLSKYTLRLVLNEYFADEGLKFVSHDDDIEKEEFIGMKASVIIEEPKEIKKRILKKEDKK